MSGEGTEAHIGTQLMVASWVNSYPQAVRVTILEPLVLERLLLKCSIFHLSAIFKSYNKACVKTLKNYIQKETLAALKD